MYSGGVSWEIPADAVISMRYCKPDGTKGYYDTMPDGTIAGAANGSTVSMMLAPQMLTVPGSVSAQLELLRENQLLGTCSFW